MITGCCWSLRILFGDPPCFSSQVLSPLADVPLSQCPPRRLGQICALLSLFFSLPTPMGRVDFLFSQSVSPCAEMENIPPPILPPLFHRAKMFFYQMPFLFGSLQNFSQRQAVESSSLPFFWLAVVVCYGRPGFSLSLIFRASHSDQRMPLPHGPSVFFSFSCVKACNAASVASSTKSYVIKLTIHLIGFSTRSH